MLTYVAIYTPALEGHETAAVNVSSTLAHDFLTSFALKVSRTWSIVGMGWVGVDPGVRELVYMLEGMFLAPYVAFLDLK